MPIPEPNKVIYSMVGVSKFHGKKQILKDIYLSYFYGAKIGVIGLNGSGKSSLLRILAGEDRDFLGETVLSPGYTVGLLHQEPQLDESKTVKEIVEEGVQPIIDLLKEFDEINNSFGDADADMDKLMERQAKVQDKLDAAGAWDLDSKLEMAMDALRCPPGETPVSILSGGEKRRVALCRLLLQEPDILLLDEPTNHLDAESVAWLEQHLQKYAGTVIAVTHDRYFLDNVAGWILELDRGEGIPWKGNYSSWLEQKQERLRREEKAESQRQKTLERELEWIHMSPKGRHAKGKARITAYEQLLTAETQQKLNELEIFIPPGPRLGNVVVEASHVKKAFGDKLLIEGMEFNLPPGGIIGVIGPNGAGKTTLFNLVTGLYAPDEGDILFAGESLLGLEPHEITARGIARTFQTLRLFLNMTVKENVMAAAHSHTRAGILRSVLRTPGMRREEREIERLAEERLAFFGQRLMGYRWNQPAFSLSYANRRRLEIARATATKARLLLLDEPAAGMNPVETHEIAELIGRLRTEGGYTILVIEHDMHVVEGISDRVVALDHGEKIAEGSFEAVATNPRVVEAYLGTKAAATK